MSHPWAPLTGEDAPYLTCHFFDIKAQQQLETLRRDIHSDSLIEITHNSGCEPLMDANTQHRRLGFKTDSSKQSPHQPRALSVEVIRTHVCTQALQHKET